MQFYSFFTAVFLLEFVDDISLNNVANFFPFFNCFDDYGYFYF